MTEETFTKDAKNSSILPKSRLKTFHVPVLHPVGVFAKVLLSSLVAVCQHRAVADWRSKSTDKLQRRASKVAAVAYERFH